MKKYILQIFCLIFSCNLLLGCETGTFDSTTDNSEETAVTTEVSDSETETDSIEETTVTEKIETEAEIVVDDSWRNAYKAKINMINSQDVYYNIYDLDNDKIPELFIVEDLYAMAGVEIYTYENGSIIELCYENSNVIGAYGCLNVIKDSGQIFYEQGAQGCFYSEVFEKSGNKFNKVKSFSDNFADGTKAQTCYIDDNKVDTDVYLDEYDKYYKGVEIVRLGYDYGCSCKNLNVLEEYQDNRSSLSHQGEIYIMPGYDRALLDDNINNNVYYDDIYTVVPGIVKTDGSTLYVRSSPEIINSPGKGNKIDCLANGTSVTIHDYEGDWAYVEADAISGKKVYGYIHIDYIQFQ